ncbi:MAG TPA: kinase [Methanothermococcus okinawensis]|uniref:Putative adenylate kinase n=1 Tax=Methanothermococcus okinawensis TaxID=155863 RepID=A0A833DQ96_9EURY|nr:kinase [Methanothermococcus okinawensis]
MKLAITGTPGVGKSTVSKALMEKLTKNYKWKFQDIVDIKYVDITKVVIENKLYTEKDEDMDSYVIDFQKLNNHINNYSLNHKKNLIIIDGHVSHLLDVDYIVVLRCNPEIVKDRLKKRNYSKNKINENVEGEILDICLIESLERLQNNNILVYEIDTTNRDIDSIVYEIIEAINNKKVKYGMVSWLEDYFFMMDCGNKNNFLKK